MSAHPVDLQNTCRIEVLRSTLTGFPIVAYECVLQVGFGSRLEVTPKAVTPFVMR